MAGMEFQIILPLHQQMQAQMSAYDPKRTWVLNSDGAILPSFTAWRVG